MSVNLQFSMFDKMYVEKSWHLLGVDLSASPDKTVMHIVHYNDLKSKGRLILSRKAKAILRRLKGLPPLTRKKRMKERKRSRHRLRRSMEGFRERLTNKLTPYE